jgi:hypothetical protein
MSAWNDFVKKIYWEGKKLNPSYEFKNALKDASKRKSEMTSKPMGPKSRKMTRKSRKGRRTRRRY